MYTRNVIPFRSSRPSVRGMGGLGDNSAAATLATAAADYYTGGAASLLTSGAGGSGGATAQPITVSPTLTTQISPQISPNFQQQFQPQNSAMTAGTSQALPGIGSGAGASPFPNYGAPASVPVPTIPTPATAYTQYIPWIVGGLIAIMGFKMMSRKNHG